MGFAALYPSYAWLLRLRFCSIGPAKSERLLVTRISFQALSLTELTDIDCTFSLQPSTFNLKP
jgi:hypothetical protein